MKFIPSIASSRRAPAICALLGTLMLSACGGGGGGASTPAVATPTATAAVTNFAQVSAMPNFTWATANKVVPAVGISRNPALGELTLLLSNYTCVDPTNPGARLHYPLRDGLLTSYSLNPAEQAATKITWNQLGLQVPAATNLLLIELVEGTSTIYSKLVQPSALATLSITLTDTPVQVTCD